MSQHEENKQETAEEENKQETAEEELKGGMDPVRTWTWIILALVFALLSWHLFSDRMTPYTSQARVHALVVPVAPEVSAIVVAVAVSNNQRVRAGQVLFSLDTKTYELDLKNAVAGLQSTRASLKKAETDAVRMRRIREQDSGAISVRRVESAEATLESARGRLDASLAKLGQARLNLERTTIYAPEDGVVSNVEINIGHFAAAGTPLMTFIAVKRIWLQADFTENNMGRMKLGSKALITFDMLPGRVFAGDVRELGFGVALSSTPPGSLPTIDNDRSWLRSAQRFPVLIDFDYSAEQDQRILRVGSQASVVVFSSDHTLLNALAWFHIHLRSILSYAY
jgi:multidrug resistance efflux pump